MNNASNKNATVKYFKYINFFLVKKYKTSLLVTTFNDLSC